MHLLQQPQPLLQLQLLLQAPPPQLQCLAPQQRLLLAQLEQPQLQRVLLINCNARRGQATDPFKNLMMSSATAFTPRLSVCTRKSANSS